MPSPRSRDADPPPVDVMAFRAAMREAGAEAAVDEILAAFIQSAPERIEAVATALGGADAVAIERAAHAFRSAAGTIGAGTLASLLGQIETSARAGAIPGAQALLPVLRREVENVLAYLHGEGGHAPPAR